MRRLLTIATFIVTVGLFTWVLCEAAKDDNWAWYP